MADELPARLSPPDLPGFAHGDHACAVWEESERLPSVATYVKGGLESGDRCVYIFDGEACDDVCAALERADVEVGAAREARRLQLFTKGETYLLGGSFDPQRMVDSLRRMSEQACADGCRGLRVTGEMSWALGSETGCDRVVEYEALLNDFFPGRRVHAICQYERDRFEPSALRAALATHPKAVASGQIGPNPLHGPHVLHGAPDGGSAWLARRVDDLEAALAARDDVISVASHELKTPLNALRLATELLRSHDLDPAAALACDAVDCQVDRLARLVGQLLDVTRLGADALELRCAGGDLLEIVRRAAARFELEAREANCELRVDGTPVAGEWDELRVEQIVANLLSNALKYGAGAPVTVRVEERGELAVVAVRDRGIGIPAEERSALFRRFERLPSGRRQDGLGLGLWIVRQLARRMGGDVSVESAPGEGSEFTVRVPRRLGARERAPR